MKIDVFGQNIMHRRSSKESTAKISKYFTRQVSREAKTGQVLEEADGDENPVQDTDKMGDVSNAALHKLLVKLDKKFDGMKDDLTALKDKVETLTDKIESVEHDVQTVKEVQKSDQEKTQEMRSEIDDLRRSLLQSQLHGRKYNLCFYGIPGHETSAEKTISTLRQFATESLKLDEKFVKQVVIRNAHRLQERDDGTPATITAVFMKWCDREAFLKNGIYLKDTPMSVRPDLPRELKTQRGELAFVAKGIRENEDLQARIRNKGIDFWIETRRKTGDPWDRREERLGLTQNRRK